MGATTNSQWLLRICVLLLLNVLPTWHLLQAESQVVGDIALDEEDHHPASHHRISHSRNHNREHLHHRQRQRQRGKHFRGKHIRSHYEMLQLEQQQQQLGKHWRHWVNHLQSSPDYASDDPSSSVGEELPHHFDHFDVEDYQRYANIELAAPRSGRHRGRHLPLNNNQLLDGSGKYLRSLPDSVNFQDRLYATQAQRHWPVKREAIVEGDVILGGLMMVHSREDSITCGPIMPQGGIQALEAMLFTIDRINREQLLPNITLGAHILDDCDKDSYGLEMAVDFIKGIKEILEDLRFLMVFNLRIY